MFNRREFLTITGLGGASLLFGDNTSFAQAAGEKGTSRLTAGNKYHAKDYSKLIGMDGLSENALKTHFTLYEGYVKNTNELMNTLSEMREDGKMNNAEFAELKRRLGWEFDGMRLHEYYFENLSKKGVNRGNNIEKKLAEDFGSFETWEKEFKAVGSMRGIGWAALYQDPIDGRLINCWINEHHASHLAGGNLILIMDVFEHAFMPDYGLKKNNYIEAFFKNIDWSAVESRLTSRPIAEATTIK